MLDKWDGSKPKYKLVQTASEMLREFYQHSAKRGQISEALERVDSLGTIDTTLTHYLIRMPDKVPMQSFGTYMRLLDRAFSNSACTIYSARSLYHRMVGMIKGSEDMGIGPKRIEFYKAVLQRLDKEVCMSIEDPLPPDHPYLQRRLENDGI